MDLIKEYSEMISTMYSKRKSYPLADVWAFLPAFQKISFEIKKDMQLLQSMSVQYRWDLQRDLQAELVQGKVIVVTNPDKVITFASHYFEKMTGYACNEAIGQKPGFLQGKDTAITDREQISKALIMREPVKAEIVNYRKTGEAYLCHIEIVPVYNTSRQFVHFMAIEQEV